MLNDLVGKTVMIRTYSAGVHYGTLEKFETMESGYYAVKLTNAIRVYKWAGACSLSQLATDGTADESGTSLSVKVPSIYLMAIEVIEMTGNAVEVLSNLKTWKI